MAVSVNQQLFIKEIYPKIKYDKTIGKYRIDASDYILLQLTKGQLKTLENICLKNDIYLEKLPAIISVKKTNALFHQLIHLREQIKNSSNNSNILEAYQKEYYQIRNKIFEAHQQVIYRIIAINIPNYDKMPDKEDIIQSGYGFLLEAIDRYDPVRCQNFRWYLYKYIPGKLFRYMKKQNQNGYYNDELTELITAREKLQKEGTDIVTIEKLARETNLSEERVKELLVLEQILNADSLDEITENEEMTDSGLIDNSQEDIIYANLFKESLMAIIDTLPYDIQKEILIYYYGLDGKEPLSNNQISKILDTTRQMIDYYRQGALKILQHPTRSKYLEELSNGYPQIEFLGKEIDFSSFDISDSVYEEIEVYLAKYLPQEELLEAIMQIEAKYCEILLYHFNFQEKQNLKTSDKIKLSGISTNIYIERKRMGLQILRRILTKKYLTDNPNENIHSLLDYLMYNYLNKSSSNIKKRSRSK